MKQQSTTEVYEIITMPISFVLIFTRLPGHTNVSGPELPELSV